MRETQAYGELNVSYTTVPGENKTEITFQNQKDRYVIRYKCSETVNFMFPSTCKTHLYAYMLKPFSRMINCTKPLEEIRKF